MTTGVLAISLVAAGCSSQAEAQRDSPPEAEKYVEGAREQLESKQLTEARQLWERARREGAPRAQVEHLGARIERATAEAELRQGRALQAYEHFLEASKLEADEQRRFEDLLAAIDAGAQAGVMPAELAPLASRAVELKTRSQEAQQRAAQLWDDAGQPERALPYYAWLHKVSPEQTSTTLRLATLYLQENQLRTARRLLEKVHRAEPDNVVASLKLADLYARLGEHDQARTLYESLVEAYPERASILMRYARYLRDRGETDRARQLQRRAREAQPGLERRQMRRLR